ncbi:DUF5360 family protein [Photobacterium alginatilyticum]|uniref:Uncharacterized protein n=1 Tax=Photobacterium alginatilyticum TaxID=1775171 RepID=A0ABW9YC42_9GAMM|nr:DUF5360 family protein [Photobacterium alginatilyticum]NBI51324.1 hypothetical protein [Photobacterium alginatilyticum]
MIFERVVLTITEVGMVLYWVFASLVVLDVMYIPPEYMYSDYTNPLVVAWNWSFFPIDIIFALTGLVARFGNVSRANELYLSVFSLSLMFCAGLMAISYWAINSEFDPFWWGVNLWLLFLSSYCLVLLLRRQNGVNRITSPVKS